MTHRPILPGIRMGGDAASAEDAAAAGLREAFSFWASGVTVIALRLADGVHGVTASAGAPLSRQPPLVLVCLEGDTPLLSHMREQKRFTVNLLSAEQRRVATTFADRFPVGASAFHAGDATLAGALASFACTLEAEHEGGDHRILIGRIEQATAADAADGPLLYYRRAYRTLG
jgi:flavin reductase (DIM6/NTAB) family NADH-FMN oxidoreductase RutF